MESGELCVMTILATSMPESLATLLVLGEVYAFLNTTTCLLSVRIGIVLFCLQLFRSIIPVIKFHEVSELFLQTKFHKVPQISSL